ncbi:hypothetical protein V8Z80_08640 [Orrella sp. JC864]|uniref:hypothetical protein n=1 Tax=Orrella sp. JC864 TaxID=3120298 RepID=UPI00300BF1BA
MIISEIRVGGPSPYPRPGAEGARLLADGSGLVLLVAMTGWADTELTAISAATPGRVHAMRRDRLLVTAWEFGRNLVFDAWTDIGAEPADLQERVAGWIGEQGRLAVTIVAVELATNSIAHLRYASLPGNVSDVMRGIIREQIQTPIDIAAYNHAVSAALTALPSTQDVIARSAAAGRLGT